LFELIFQHIAVVATAAAARFVEARSARAEEKKSIATEYVYKTPLIIDADRRRHLRRF